MTVKYTHDEPSDMLLVLGTCNSLVLVLVLVVVVVPVLVPVLNNTRTIVCFNNCSSVCVRQKASAKQLTRFDTRTGVVPTECPRSTS